MKNIPARLRKPLRLTGIIVLVCFGLLVLVFLAVQFWPGLGAQGADALRHVLGDKTVAGLEMRFNQLQDGIRKVTYRLGFEKPVAPWQAPTAAPTALDTQTMTFTPAIQTPVAFQSTFTPAANIPQPAATPTAYIWQPTDLVPIGGAEGEGIWSPYFQDAAGTIVAYRTFLQPDVERPYTLVAVVAVDLMRTRLHFVLGSQEPVGEDKTPRSGAIPAADRMDNVLLAAFNGGFQSRHGYFGAMADGITALPPREGLGTLVIYKSGRVSLGEWGTGMAIIPNVAAFRQNGPLVVQQGQINPRIHNNSPQDWGYTVNDVSPTVRTGVGLSRDEKTLYYFCGPSLSMEMLAKTMQAAGAWNAIQLDINSYWALFVTFHPGKYGLEPEALLPRLMVANIERYLWDYTRDYFYITSVAR